MNHILDIVKITIPALIVFLAVYFVLKKFFNSQIELEQLKLYKERKRDTLNIKLQAYERLALFCERISIPNLLGRLKMSSMTNKDLEAALYIAIQKEYEHNMVQQIYVSESLWKIIELVKNQIIGIITVSASELSKDNNSDELANKIFEMYNGLAIKPDQKALSAIKKETELIL